MDDAPDRGVRAVPRTFGAPRDNERTASSNRLKLIHTHTLNE